MNKNSSSTADPFEDSKMTFGEHLEELRGALLRSVLGIVAGLLIALPVAPTVVRWIEWPLQRALKKHYLILAKDKIQAGDFADTAPERLTGVEQFNMLPERMYLDRAELDRQFGDPAADEPSSGRQFLYQVSDLQPDRVMKMADQLVKAGQSSKLTTHQAIWETLSPDTRESVLTVSQDANDREAATAAMAAALNEALQNSELSQHAAFASFKTILPHDPARRELLEALRSELNHQFSLERALNLNRHMLDAVFRDAVRSYRPQLVEFTVWRPLDVSVQALSVHEPFMIYLKAALITGFILASPWVFYQIWEFVAAGLYPHERKFVHRFLPFSIALFLTGAAMAFFLVFQPVLDFLLQFNRRLGISAEPRITDWLNFVLLLPIGFGLSFQLPLVMLFLERIGVLEVASYLAHWRIAVLIIFVMSMLLTPADPISMLMMGVPLTGLYFAGIWLCRVFPRATSSLAEQEPGAELSAANRG